MTNPTARCSIRKLADGDLAGVADVWRASYVGVYPDIDVRTDDDYWRGGAVETVNPSEPE